MFSARLARRSLLLLLVCASTLGTTAGPALAQSVTASLEGTVVDPSGAVVPGATITLVQAATGVERVAITDANGMFSAPLLPSAPTGSPRS